MSAFEDRLKKLSPQQLALLAIDLKKRLDKAGESSNEPLAVVGIGCEFPGASGPEQFWQRLESGDDLISEIPSDRWNLEDYFDADPDVPGKMITRYGGFVDQVDQFDHDFFGISKREANMMDPQQRLLLEVTWQTLENANIDPDSLRDTQTGVFVGICNSDFFVRQAAADLREMDMYISTGTAHSVASGRLSYVLGLRGPTVSIDTACSSSLVAVHMACQSLRAGECRMALAGGVNLILLPEITVSLSQAGMLSPDGRCKAFDDSANGFVRGEGCGMVALKRLSDAKADGDKVIALIHGSATNQDGRSHGLTAPNGPSQEAVIRNALKSAGLKPDQVTLIEAHGTGTSLGDPIEARALANVFGKRAVGSDKLTVGSVKSNIGHAESAAGVAGLIKLILCANRARIPQSLHHQTLNSHIDWEGLPIEVARNGSDWKPENNARIGGVSSFGFSGSNAHVIVGSAEPASLESVDHDYADRLWLPLSAQSETALKELATAYARLLADKPASNLPALCHGAATQRAHFSYRAAIPVDSQHQLISALESIAAGNPAADVIQAYASATGSVKPAFMFPGQGSQYAGMSQGLYQCNAAYAEALDACETALGDRLELPLKDVIFGTGDADAERINDTAMTQVGIFAVEYAMTRMFQAAGVQPGLLIGHSIGEYAAACIAGVFSLQDALTLVYERGKLCGALPATGMMAAVFAEESQLSDLLADLPSVSIAATNAPGNVVLSGDKSDLKRLLSELADQGISSRPLNISNAFHSPAIEPVVDKFRAVLSKVSFAAPRIPVVSNLTGTIVHAEEIGSPDYWCQHLREPVRFMQGMQAALTAGHRVFLEVGAHPVLTGLAMTCPGADGAKFVTSLRRDENDLRSLRGAWQGLYAAGCALAWPEILTPCEERVALPNYPFQRVRCWPDGEMTGTKPGERSGRRQGFEPERIQIAGFEESVFQIRVNRSAPSYLNDHQVFDKVIMPSPAYLEFAAASACAAHGLGKSTSIELGSLAISEALVFPDDKDLVLQARLEKGESGLANFEILAATQSNAELEFSSYARGTVGVGHSARLADKNVDLDKLRAELESEEHAGDFYPRMRELGLQFGNDFQCLRSIRKGERCAMGQIELPVKLRGGDSHYCMHPALLDSCFHLLAGLVPKAKTEDPFLLMGIERIQLDGLAPERVFALASARASQSEDMLLADMELFDDSGCRFAVIEGVELRRATVREFADAKSGKGSLNYALTWRDDPNQRRVCQVEQALTAEALAKELANEAHSLAQEHDIDAYELSLDKLEDRAEHYIRKAFHDLNWQPEVGELVESDALRSQLGVEEQHARLFHRMLSILAEEDILSDSKSGFKVNSAPGLASLPPELGADHDVSKNCAAELDILDRCARELANVLTGATDPIGLLFPGGDFSSVEALYKDAPYALACNRLVGLGVERCIARSGGASKLRILEIGAGTGSTSSEVLGRCDPDNTEYVFTDVSPLFLERARERFREHKFIRFELFDVEQDAAAQGLDLGQFDIVIAANVLHATQDLGEVVRNAASMLKDDGCLLAIEGTRATRWVDLTFGYTDGWWRFTDTDLRPHHALLSRVSWDELLTECGFSADGLLGGGYENPSQEVMFARLRRQVETAESFDKRVALVGPNASLRSGLAEALGESFESVEHASTAMELGDACARLDALVVVPDFQRSYDADKAGISSVDVSMLAIESMQALLQQRAEKARLYLLTCGGQKLQADELPDPAQSTIWGLGRVMSLEHPEQFGGLIDLDPSQSIDRSAVALAPLLGSDSFEDQQAIRQGQRYLARLVSKRHEPRNVGQLSQHATYLVTGGLGGLGLEVGRWLANNGAGNIALVSRRQLPPPQNWSTLTPGSDEQLAAEAIEFMQAQGARVQVVSADIAKAADIAGVFRECKKSGRPIAGVVHSAVAMSDAPILSMDRSAVTAMYDAKVQGTLNLDALCKEFETDFLALFSSTTALLGVSGLGHYAAANLFMDALAERARSEGRNVVSINWGTWEVMRVASEDDRQRFSDTGLQPLTLQSALDELGQAIAGDQANRMVADVRWDTLKSMYEVRRPRPLLDELGRSTQSRQTQSLDAEPAAGSMAGLSALTGAKRREALVDLVSQVAAQVLGSSASVRPERGFFDMGMDSLMAVELKTQLESTLDAQLPSTLTFNYPSIDAVVDFLLDDLFEEDSEAEMIDAVDYDHEPTDTAPLSDDELSQKLADKLKDLGLE